MESLQNDKESTNTELVSKWLMDFDAESVRNSVLEENIEYLEKTIRSLETLCAKSVSDSHKADTARARAIARDTEKTVSGMINGIKFAISFMLYGKEENLNDNSLS